MQLITRKVPHNQMIIKLRNTNSRSTEVQMIVIVTSKRMHIVFHAKIGPNLE